MERQNWGFCLILEFASGGISNAITSAILNPMDVSKTRMQVENMETIGTKSKKGLAEVVMQLYKEGGLSGLWKPGLSATIARELTYSGSRAGLYVPVRNFYNGGTSNGKKETLVTKIAAAMTTGAAGSIVANPIDVAKIRSMVNPNRYPSFFGALLHIYRTEGYRGLYKGLVPSTLRGAAISTGQMASYDHAKYLLKSGLSLKEGPLLHTCASLIAGLISTTVAAPFDIVKTRCMNSSGETFGFFITLRTIIREEGVFQLFRGWVPSYMRLGPHALICFPIFEQIRTLFGLTNI